MEVMNFSEKLQTKDNRCLQHTEYTATLAALQNVITFGLQTERKDENWGLRTYTCIWK